MNKTLLHIERGFIVVALFCMTCAISSVAQAATCPPGEFCNYLSAQFSTIPNFISGFLKVVVLIALPIISLFMVYSGFLFVKARGNPEQLKQARANFVYVIIGSIFILGAWVFATLIGGTVGELTQGL
jgi:hypothetical protein